MLSPLPPFLFVLRPSFCLNPDCHRCSLRGHTRDRGGKRVAVKKITRIFEQETDAKRILREIYILRHMAHRNVIQLLNVLLPTRADKNTFNELYLVFEFVDTDLYKLIMSPQYLTAQVRRPGVAVKALAVCLSRETDLFPLKTIFCSTSAPFSISCSTRSLTPIP